jgi:hypothetical protein
MTNKNAKLSPHPTTKTKKIRVILAISRFFVFYIHFEL